MANVQRVDDARGFADKSIAEALLDAVAGWSEWCLRRVDSVQPLEGERGRLRPSLDRIPPPDPRLAYVPSERRRRIAALQGPIVVPIAIVNKQPMRELDAALGDTTPLPLLTMSENVELAAAMLEYALEKQEIHLNQEL